MLRISAAIRGGSANIFGGRATETSSPAPFGAGGDETSNLYVEQSKIKDQR